jgi:GTP-binding protein EngB required for normal cell division
LKVLSAEFVTSAADARAVPRDGLPQIALVGRSNVGKSTLINALTGRTIARTSATPGKTRLANLYRVHVQGGRPEASGALAGWRLYLTDLPGYGYVRGAKSTPDEFARIADAYFGGRRPEPGGRSFRGHRPEAGGRGKAEGRRAKDKGARGQRDAEGAAERQRAGVGPRGQEAQPVRAALLVIDARHPALDSDLAAREWLDSLGLPYAIVATKIDKLPRSARPGALHAIVQQHNRPALPVSADAGEGLEELWTQIVTLLRR